MKRRAKDFFKENGHLQEMTSMHFNPKKELYLQLKNI